MSLCSEIDSKSESYSELSVSESDVIKSGCSNSHATIVSGVTNVSGIMPSTKTDVTQLCCCKKNFNTLSYYIRLWCIPYGKIVSCITAVYKQWNTESTNGQTNQYRVGLILMFPRAQYMVLHYKKLTRSKYQIQNWETRTANFHEPTSTHFWVPERQNAGSLLRSNEIFINYAISYSCLMLRKPLSQYLLICSNLWY